MCVLQCMHVCVWCIVYTWLFMKVFHGASHQHDTFIDFTHTLRRCTCCIHIESTSQFNIIIVQQYRMPGATIHTIKCACTKPEYVVPIEQYAPFKVGVQVHGCIIEYKAGGWGSIQSW